jgi:uncharacterized protein (TIGR03086 family)
MSDTADRYRRLAGLFAATVAAVPDDRWEAQSPCDEWTARDVVRHVVQTQGMFLGFVGRGLGDAPTVDDDPVGAWDHARAAMQADLDEPERAATSFDGLMGPTTLEAAVDRFLCTDLVVHRWDLAEATGQPLVLDPVDMAHARDAMAPLADRMRGPGAMGPELEVAPDADEQARFLAFFGRRSTS